MRIVPKYSVPYIAACILLNLITYTGTKLIIKNRYHYSFATGIDDKIPFVSEMIIFYVLAYLLWVVGYVVIARESEEVCKRVFVAELIAKFVCLLCFILIPTTIVRPDISNQGGFCIWLTSLIYNHDTPENLFPSIHCLESWFCFRGALYCHKPGRIYKIVVFIVTILVFCSTVMVKQHVFVDVISAIVLVEICLFITRNISVRRKNER